MDNGNDNPPSVHTSAHCCIHLQSLLACVNKPKALALAISRDQHTALLLFIQIERVNNWTEIKGIKQLGKNITAQDKMGFVNRPLFCGLGILQRAQLQYFLRTDNQSHPQETLQISWNQMVEFLFSQDTNTGRHLERVT